jgi:hypothetical protein
LVTLRANCQLQQLAYFTVIGGIAHALVATTATLTEKGMSV